MGDGAQFLYKGATLPRIHFQQQLAALKDKLLAMAALSQQAVISSVDAYLQRDAGLCQYVRENETAINAAQREVDEMAYELLAQEQPMAIDLRFILAVIKINGDLERVGDQSMSIAIRTQELLQYPAVELPVLPEEMAAHDAGDLMPELRQALGQALAQLKPRPAEIFALRFLEGFSNPQIAQMLGISQVLVAVIVHRTWHPAFDSSCSPSCQTALGTRYGGCPTWR